MTRRLACVLLLSCASCDAPPTPTEGPPAFGVIRNGSIYMTTAYAESLRAEMSAVRDSLRAERRKVAEMLDLLDYEAAGPSVNDKGIEVRTFVLAGAVDSFGLAVPLRVDRLGRVVVAP